MKKPLFITLLLITFLSCSKDEIEPIPINEVETIDENNYTKLTEGTVIIEAAENQTKVAENEITIITNTEKILNLKVGQIIVSGRSENEPNGYAKRITNINKSGNTITLNTVEVGIDEVYEELVIDSKIKVDYKNFKPINATRTRPSGRKNSINLNRPLDVQLNATTNKFDIKTVLYDKDGNYDTKNDQILYDGSVKVVENNSSFIFNKKLFTPNIFNLTNEIRLEVTNNIEITASLELEKKEISIAKIPLTMSLPTSFVINLFLELKLGVEGNITGSISVSNEATIYTIASLSYDETNGWMHPNASTFNSETSFGGSVEMELKPYLATGIALEFTQYKNASAGIFLETYVKFNAESDSSLNTNWDFGYGLELKAQAEVTILKTFIDVDYEAIIWELPYKILYQGENLFEPAGEFIVNTKPFTLTKGFIFSDFTDDNSFELGSNRAFRVYLANGDITHSDSEPKFSDNVTQMVVFNMYSSVNNSSEIKSITYPTYNFQPNFDTDIAHISGARFFTNLEVTNGTIVSGNSLLSDNIGLSGNDIGEVTITESNGSYTISFSYSSNTNDVSGKFTGTLIDLN